MKPDPTPPAAEKETELPPEQWQPKKHGLFGTLAFSAAILAGVAGALYAWKLPPFTSSTVSTENAYVRGQTTVISPRVNGYVSEVLVSDFAEVKQGQPLVRIDDAPYQAKVAQAKAGLAAQEASLSNVGQTRRSAQAQIQARQAALANAENQLRLAQADVQRLNRVRGSEGIAEREYDAAARNLQQAEAALAQARAQYTVAQQDSLSVNNGQSGLKAGVDNARALLALAEQELSHTVVRAPADGKLGELGVKPGQLVSAGNQLMFLVPPQRWVVANFKEADTEHIRVGQAALIRVDALGGRTFKGKVSHLAPATAAEFSIIRADSGNGNFVKVAQRIAVKIELDAGQPDVERLLPGMSVEAEVDTR